MHHPKHRASSIIIIQRIIQSIIQSIIKASKHHQSIIQSIMIDEYFISSIEPIIYTSHPSTQATPTASEPPDAPWPSIVQCVAYETGTDD